MIGDAKQYPGAMTMSHDSQTNPYAAPLSLEHDSGQRPMPCDHPLEPPVEFDCQPSLDETLLLVPLAVRKPTDRSMLLYLLIFILMGGLLWLRPNFLFGLGLLFFGLGFALNVAREPLMRRKLISLFKREGLTGRRVKGKYSCDGVERQIGKEGVPQFIPWSDCLEARMCDIGAVLICRLPNSRRKQALFITRGLFASEADWLRLRDHLACRFDVKP